MHMHIHVHMHMYMIYMCIYIHTNTHTNIYFFICVRTLIKKKTIHVYVVGGLPQTSDIFFVRKIFVVSVCGAGRSPPLSNSRNARLCIPESPTPTFLLISHPTHAVDSWNFLISPLLIPPLCRHFKPAFSPATSINQAHFSS